MLKLFKYTFILYFLLLSGALAEESRNVLIVSGRGEIEVEPDMATITLGVSTIDFSAEEAYLENNSKMARVIDELKELGVDKRDIKTTRFSINPSYDYDRKTGEKKFKGYQVNHSITVKVRNLKTIGKLLDQIVSAGVTDISGISFGVQNPEKFESAARKLAVKDAHTKATELAQAAGVTLGPAVRIEESRGTPRPFPVGAERLESAPVEPGMARVAVRVTIHYLIE